MPKLSEKIKEYALNECFFDVIGFAPVQPSDHHTIVQNWVKQGYHGGMKWYERSVDTLVNPQKLFDSAKTIITLGVNYYPFDYPEEVLNDPSRGIIARYAVYDDYHEILLPKLIQLKEFIEKELGRKIEYRAYVDTGPVLEREIAARAGTGFIGRNTTLINFEYGSWVLLAELVVDVELGIRTVETLPWGVSNDETRKGHVSTPATCGTCTRCIDICPTKALVSPYTLDANKCISYLTIEHRGIIPREFRSAMKNRIYGCDICQEICPWNKSRQKQSTHPDFHARMDLYAPKLLDLFPMSQSHFSARFKNSPIKRAKREGFVRNVLVALGNWADPSLVPILEHCLQDESPVIRAHTVWALRHIGTQNAKDVILKHKSREIHPRVLEEI